MDRSVLRQRYDKKFAFIAMCRLIWLRSALGVSPSGIST
jgi:hypothetical protein